MSLYLVATPIGNLEDITLRAVRVLREVKLIAAEDTRKTRILLSRYGIKTAMVAYHEHNKLARLENLLTRLQEEDVALVSEAGTPGLSDPGYELVVAAVDRGIPVVPIPGPSAVVTALAISGLPTDRFLYVGFLSRKGAERRRRLGSVVDEPGTIVILESPHRLKETLADILSVLGDRRMAVCRELTKIHEEVFRGTVGEAVEHFQEPRGEFVLVVAGTGKSTGPGLTEAVEEQLRRMKADGVTARNAVAEIAGETGISRKVLYRLWLTL